MIRILLSALILAFSGFAHAAKPQVHVTVYLSKNLISVEKENRRGRSQLTGPIVPVAAGTVPTGTFKIARMIDRYQSSGGNVILENVVRTAGGFNLRTSRMFHEWVKSNRPANRTIVLEPEMGSLLFTTIRNLGLANTTIQILP